MIQHYVDDETGCIWSHLKSIEGCLLLIANEAEEGNRKKDEKKKKTHFSIILWRQNIRIQPEEIDTFYCSIVYMDREKIFKHNALGREM